MKDTLQRPEASLTVAQADPALLTLQLAAFMMTGVIGRPEDGLIRLLFIGNSFTFRNGGLAAVQALLLENYVYLIRALPLLALDLLLW